jgi:hypothetical protein
VRSEDASTFPTEPDGRSGCAALGSVLI